MLGDYVNLLKAHHEAEIARLKADHAQEVANLDARHRAMKCIYPFGIDKCKVALLATGKPPIESKRGGYCVNCGYTERITPNYAKQPESRLRCEFCKDIEPWHHGDKFCWNCGRNLKRPGRGCMGTLSRDKGVG